MDWSRRRIAIAVLAVVLCLLLVVGGALALTADEMRVSSIDSTFGEVTAETTTIDTAVVVDNPNRWSVPGGVDVEYSVSLNDVHLTDGDESGTALPPGTSTVETDATFDNGKIAEWWLSHVDNGERTELRVDGTVSPRWLPTDFDVPEDTVTIETDLLDAVGGFEADTLTVDGQPVLEVGEQDATWGAVNDDRTVMEVSTDVTNRHDRPIELAGTAYEIRMNEVVVGEGESINGLDLEPGASGTLEVALALEADAMASWWEQHVDRDETTSLHVEVVPLVERDGDVTALPTPILERTSTFHTDLLGTGTSSIEPGTPTIAEDVSIPTVDAVTSRWGMVHDDHTEIHTEVSMHNPNPADLSSFIDASVNQQVVIGDRQVAEGTTRLDGLGTGHTTPELTGTKPHDVVPAWWADHLNRGEVSSVTAAATVDVDLGLTTIPVTVDERYDTVETDLLAGVNSDDPSVIGEDEVGQPVLTIHEVSADWGTATPKTAPVQVTADLENHLASTLTISDIDHTTDINGVTVADERLDETVVLGPHERTEVPLELTMDTARMADWWPTHVQADETSTVTRSMEATVNVAGMERRVTLEPFSGEEMIETDLLS